MLTNCLLVLLLWWGFDHEWVEKVGLLAVRLVIGLVTKSSSQLGSFFVEIILGPETDKTVQSSWTVWEEDLRDD